MKKPPRPNLHDAATTVVVVHGAAHAIRAFAVLLCCSIGAFAPLGTAHAQTVLAAPTPARSSTAPAVSDPDARWSADLAAFDAADQAQPQPPGGVLFIGSSSIRRWTSLEHQFAQQLPVVIRRGLGGSRIDDWSRQLNRLVLRYRPRLVLLYAGDNDIAEGRSPTAVLASVKKFVTGVRSALHGTRIAFISIKPSPRRSQWMANVREANALVRAYAEADPTVDYIDVFTPMLDKDGQPREELFLPDGLHLNDTGYSLWRSVIADRLR